MNRERFVSYAPAVTRIGISLVFIWFGVSQFTDPASWTGYIPTWLPQSGTLVVANGIIETILGSLLLVGLLVRPIALILGIHLLGITWLMGYTAIGVRDFGLALATLSIALHGKDGLCTLSRH